VVKNVFLVHTRQQIKDLFLEGVIKEYLLMSLGKSINYLDARMFVLTFDKLSNCFLNL